jgi:hypothetical protein
LIFFLGCKKFIIAAADATEEAGCLIGDFVLIFGVPESWVSTVGFVEATTAGLEEDVEEDSELFLFFDGFTDVLASAAGASGLLFFFACFAGALVSVAVASTTGSFFACK